MAAAKGTRDARRHDVDLAGRVLAVGRRSLDHGIEGRLHGGEGRSVACRCTLGGRTNCRCVRQLRITVPWPAPAGACG